MKSEVSLNGIFPLTDNRPFYDRSYIVLVAFTLSGGPTHTHHSDLAFIYKSI
jgi:hypothetical protein